MDRTSRQKVRKELKDLNNYIHRAPTQHEENIHYPQVHMEKSTV